MRDDGSARATAIVQALVAVIVWGASFAATKQLLTELSPANILFTRTVLGAVLIGGGLAARGRLRPLAARDRPRVVVLALLGLVLTQLLQAFALERSTSATTAWLVAMNPVVTAILAAWLIGERLDGRIAGLALAFAGVVLVVGRGAPVAEVLALPSTRGDALTLLSTVCWALYTIRGRDLATRRDPVLVTFHLLATAAIVYAPWFVLGQGWQELARLSAEGWLCLAYLGFGCSGLAFMLYQAALRHLEASQVAAFIYLEPLVAQALGVAMLGEPLSAAVLTGGAAILFGVYLVSRPRRTAAVVTAP